MNLATTWLHLETDTPTAPAERVQRRIEPGGPRDFFLGLELPSRRRMLILRTRAEFAEGCAPVPETRGLDVRIRLRQEQQQTAEIELVLMDSTHRDIFDLLIQDLVREAQNAVDEPTAVSRFFARLTDWQLLLMRVMRGGLSRESQQGLWGELWVLLNIVAPAIGFPAACRAWRGPGANQDFQHGHAAVEVKTSTSHAFDIFTIASERQLEAPAGVQLALVALGLDARPGHGQTLPELVGTLRAVARDHAALDLLESGLSAWEYRDEEQDLYQDLGYSIRSQTLFLVQGEFPRIIADDLKPGVMDVRYSIASAACERYRIDDESLRQIW